MIHKIITGLLLITCIALGFIQWQEMKMIESHQRSIDIILEISQQQTALIKNLYHLKKTIPLEKKTVKQ